VVDQQYFRVTARASRWKAPVFPVEKRHRPGDVVIAGPMAVSLVRVI
jgi:hypothetical protein